MDNTKGGSPQRDPPFVVLFGFLVQIESHSQRCRGLVAATVVRLDATEVLQCSYDKSVAVTWLAISDMAATDDPAEYLCLRDVEAGIAALGFRERLSGPLVGALLWLHRNRCPASHKSQTGGFESNRHAVQRCQ